MPAILKPWTATLARVDDMLRGRRDPSFSARAARFWHFVAILIAAGCWYGAVMGGFSGTNLPRLSQIACSAAKVPLLLLATFWLTVPSFFVVNTLLGLRSDFPESLKKLGAAQATLTIVLASLSPLTALWYASVPDYHEAIIFNAAMFTIASTAAQWSLRRDYRPLIRRNPRHAWMLRTWLAIYSFVGIQMGWVLRPFIGNPVLPTTFFRRDAFTNAYTFVAHLLVGTLR
jgi:hypothetical protein